MREDNQKTILAILTIECFCLSVVNFSTPSEYDRIDMINQEDFKFKIMNTKIIEDSVGKAYLYSKKAQLSIDNIPDKLNLKCYQKKDITIKLINHDKYVIKDLDFNTKKHEYIDIIPPNKISVPPLSSREITFFITTKCPDQNQIEINQVISITGTDIEFNIPILLNKRLE